MADEIRANLSLTVTKGSLSLSKLFNDTADMAGTKYSAGCQSIGHAAHEALVVSGDIATAGWAYFRNTDATNFVQVGVDVSTAFHPLVKLLPGEACVLRLATTAVYAKADTAAVDLDYVVFEA
jgi:hypothetical protein